VYSNVLSIKELNDFITENYKPIVKKTIIQKTSTKNTNKLYNMNVYSLTGFDYKNNNNMEVDKQVVKISKCMNNIFLDPVLHNVLQNQIERFNDANWFIERGIPRTLGILMHGSPGCGKTSVIKALASFTKRRVIIIDLKKVHTKEQLQNIFSGKFKINSSGDIATFTQDEVIYVLDDFDCMSDIFMDRDLKNEQQDDKIIIGNQKLEIEYLKKKLKNIKKNDIKMITKKDKKGSSDSDNDDINLNDLDHITKGDFDYTKSGSSITLQNILEILDGVIEMDGRIIVMTTNKRDILDPALIRPGRIDLDLEFEYPKRDLILYIFNYMYKNYSQEERHDVLKKYGKIIKDRELSTAKIINCFMFMDINEGMQCLLSNYQDQDMDSGYSNGENEDDDFDAIECLSKITIEIDNITSTLQKNTDIMNEIDIDDVKIYSSSNGSMRPLQVILMNDKLSFESLFSNFDHQYIRFVFPKNVCINSYKIVIPICSNNRISNWQLIGLKENGGTEYVLDEQLDFVIANDYTSTVSSDEYFSRLVLKTVGNSKCIDGTSAVNCAMDIEFIQFLGHVET
jgi:hypothetical protein